MSLNLLKQALRLLTAVTFGSLLLAASGCNDEKDFSRERNLLAFFDPADPKPTNAIVSVSGGDTVLYVRSDVSYSMNFRSGDKQNDWVHIDSLGYDAEVNAVKYHIMCAPIQEGTFKKRTGTLSIVCPGEFMGQFILFSQGFDTRLQEDFSWLNTGSDIPFNTTGEKLFKDWTLAQQEKGWKAPLVSNQAEAYLYSKKGYIKLGDGAHAVEVLTPDLSKMVSDTIALLTFKGVAYADEQGVRDNNKLTVSIENGGRFANNTKQVEFNLPYYDPSAPDLAKTMWEKTTRVLVLVTDKNEKFTNSTAIRFSTPEDANRIFLDDITIYTIDRETIKIFGNEFENPNF